MSAVAAVYDRRQTLIANGVTAVAPGGSAPPKTMAILAENAVFLEHDPAETQLGVKNQGKAAFVANALKATRSTFFANTSFSLVGAVQKGPSTVEHAILF